jgi:hypothetical protein
MIGWQAMEAHFLRLQYKLPKLSHVTVVGANSSDAENILKYFLEEISWTVPHQYVGLGSFTQFVVSQEGVKFLTSW